ncbi:SDR family NAD(P)-dependent oxidoreductase [Lysinibacillus telephonicus]|uniref:SDR family NAD(P)-dependent oxidoreductase n=1 Tax=Lysinibacillus telephonicus TaxID=1714840 RepID=A0A3S0JQ24_9BACI|nr:SDR family NAD(P)-dependent oxidoreductase [Lysinibacillus telephonicus]RTQ93411.1 SDR family NAD(P)-dependent oxidoreductase [Lysinibacillus telephonicus]
MNKKNIFITGATSGIGRIITEKCIKQGFAVYATGRNETALAQLSSLGVHVFKADITNVEEIDKLCNQLPSINIAILNAGVGVFQNAFDLADGEIDEMIDVNVKAPIYLASRLSKNMIEQNFGHIIFIGSQAGKVATKKASVYAASKHAITGFANGLRMELKPYNIKVSVVYPGPIDTPFLQKADSTDNYRNSIEKFLLKPEKVADEVIKLMNRPVREVNLPRVMAITSKLYAIAPKFVEQIGRGFFNKK